MITLIVIVAVLIIAAFITWYERYQRQLYIAKVIDGHKVDQKFISQECQLVIIQLQDKPNLKVRNYNSMLILPDGQEISYRFDDLQKMKDTSKLRFEPTPMEWEILRGIIKKVIR